MLLFLGSSKPFFLPMDNHVSQHYNTFMHEEALWPERNETFLMAFLMKSGHKVTPNISSTGTQLQMVDNLQPNSALEFRLLCDFAFNSFQN